MKDIFIYKNNTIIETLEKLQKVGSQCLIVVNKNYSLLGTISDGDVRRAILKNNTEIDLHGLENLVNRDAKLLDLGAVKRCLKLGHVDVVA